MASGASGALGRRLVACLLNISEAGRKELVETVAEAALYDSRGECVFILASQLRKLKGGTSVTCFIMSGTTLTVLIYSLFGLKTGGFSQEIWENSLKSLFHL